MTAPITRDNLDRLLRDGTIDAYTIAGNTVTLIADGPDTRRRLAPSSSETDA